MQRITAKHIDVDIFTDNLVGLQFVPDTDKFVAVAANGEVGIVSVSEAADQSLVTNVCKVELGTAVSRLSIIAGAEGTRQALIVGNNGKLFTVDIASDVTTFTAVEKVKAEGTTFLDASVLNKVAALPGDDCVQLVSTEDWSSLLKRDWRPHGDEKVDIVQVLDGKKGDALRVITAAEHGNEIRLWTVKDGAPTLTQGLTMEAEQDGAKAPPRKMLVDPDEGYITLISADEETAITMEINSEAGSDFSIRRLTEWSVPGALVCGSLVIRKVAAGSSSSRLKVELSIIGRSREKVMILAMDPERLDGPANIGELAEKPSATDEPNVLKWFGQKEASTPATGPSVQVSSSTRGGSQAANREDSRAKEEAAVQVARHTEQVRYLLNHIKEQVESLQPMASANLTILQSPDIIQKIDQLSLSSAQRVRVPSDMGAAGDVRQYYSAIADASLKQMETVTATAFYHALKRQAPIIAPRLQGGGGLSAKDIQIPKLGSTDSMKMFTTRVERGHAQQNEALKAEVAKARQMCTDAVAAAKKRSSAAMATSKHHLKSVQNAITELKADVAVAAAAQPRASGSAAPVAQDASNVFDKCKGLARSGAWEDAFAALLEASNLNVLLQFLELDDVVNNRATITGPTCLSFPVIHALCLQLTHNVTAHTGLIALRVGWIHDILVGWSDRFNDLKDGKDPDSEMFNRCSYDFMTMSQTLSQISRTDVDPATRRQLQVVRILLSKLQ